MEQKNLVSEIIAEQRSVIKEQIEFCNNARQQLLIFAADMEVKVKELKKYLDGEEEEND